MIEFSGKTLSQIVTEHHRTAGVFQSYGLDFCCKGKRSLHAACEEKGIAMEEVVDKLKDVLKTNDSAPGFDSMSLTELVEHIVRVHHSYLKLNMPQIFNYALKVATKHGDSYPFMKEVYMLFGRLRAEMELHMEKEEKELFPRIKLLELNASSLDQNPGAVEVPVQLLEEDHANAGFIMARIRELTGNYIPPEKACTTFRALLGFLKEFEEDLHRHVHLENNILFPKFLECFAPAASR